MQDWNIKECGKQCRACGAAFGDQETFCSRLAFGEEGYVRDDYCLRCWSEDARPGALSVWRSVFRPPPPPAPEPLKKETAESLLRQFMETDDPSRRNAIFILAVMLERRRVLAERDVQAREDGVKVRVYEHRKTGETFLVPDPGLKLAELAHVQREVMDLLGIGKNGDASGAAGREPAPPAV